MLNDWTADDISSTVSFEGSSIPLESILDHLDEEYFPAQNSELSGGFKIDQDVFDEEN